MEMDDLVPIPDFEVEEVDDIHDRMLSNINDRYGKVEGLFPWDGPRTTAIEIQKEQIATQNMYYNGFLNASMEFLYMKLWARRMGVDWKPAVPADGMVHFIGETGKLIPSGTTARYVGTDDVLYFVSEEDTLISAGEASVRFVCTTAGTVGNILAHSLELVEEIDGVTEIDHEAFTSGIDEETKEALFKRTLEKVRNPGVSGNAAHYRQWAMSRPGVADARAYPVWNGNGTVKVVLLDVNGQAPDQSVIDDVKHYIDSVRTTGWDLTVVGVTELSINIEAKVQPASFSDVATIRQQFIPAVQEYLKSLAFKDPLVRWTRIATLLGDVPDVIDYEGLTVNGGTANIEISEETVATLGTVNFYE